MALPRRPKRKGGVRATRTLEPSKPATKTTCNPVVRPGIPTAPSSSNGG